MTRAYGAPAAAHARARVPARAGGLPPGSRLSSGPVEAFRIVGGARLTGEVRVTGAKNSVLKLMAAALLAEGTTVLHEVPHILDVEYMAELLRRLGCVVVHDVPTRTVSITVPEVPSHKADYDLVRRLRASINVLGPLLARCGEADVALPGGDNIGSRGLDMHVAGPRAARRHRAQRARLPHRHPRPSGCTARRCGSTSPASAPPRTCSWPPCSPRARPSSTTRRASPRSSTSAACCRRWARGSTAWGPRRSRSRASTRSRPRSTRPCPTGSWPAPGRWRRR